MHLYPSLAAITRFPGVRKSSELAQFRRRVAPDAVSVYPRFFAAGGGGLMEATRAAKNENSAVERGSPSIIKSAEGGGERGWVGRKRVKTIDPESPWKGE